MNEWDMLNPGNTEATDWIAAYEAGASQTAAASDAAYGNAVFDPLNVSYNPDPGLSDDPTSEAAQAYAKAAIVESATSGKPVNPVAQSIITQSGLDWNSIVTAGGAIFKVITSANGQRVAQPVNAAAQAKVASAAKSSQIMLYAGVGLLAFAFLR